MSWRSQWWRHQIETSSALLALCAGNSLVTSESPAQRLVTRSFDVFLDLRLNKWWSKQSWGWWFETPSCSLLRRCNALTTGNPTGCRTSDFPRTLFDICNVILYAAVCMLRHMRKVKFYKFWIVEELAWWLLISWWPDVYFWCPFSAKMA